MIFQFEDVLEDYEDGDHVDAYENLFVWFNIFLPQVECTSRKSLDIVTLIEEEICHRPNFSNK